MRALILINNELTIYNFRQEFLKILYQEGIEVIIAMPEGKYEDLFLQLGCKKVVRYALSQQGMNPFKDFRLPSLYRKIIREIRPDIVLTYTIKPNIYGGIASQLEHVPYCATITGLGAAFEHGSLIRWISLLLYRIGLLRANTVFFQNEEHHQLFSKHHIAKNKHLVVPGSGVNLKKHCYEEYPSEDNGLNFLFVGRVTKDKGVNELFDAFERLCENFPESSLHLGILGSIEFGYQDIIRKYDGSAKVSIYGRHENVHDYIKAAHCVILPSYHEGMANVLLEAAACGRPVIASNIPGCKESFDDGISGISCVPKSANSLYDAISKFISLPFEEKQAMGVKGRQKMEEQFDRKYVNHKYLEVIKTIIG